MNKEKRGGGKKPLIRAFCDVWLSSGTKDSAVAPQRLTRGRRRCRLLVQDGRTNVPWSFWCRCLYCDVSSYNRPVADQCQPGLGDSCKVPKFTRHQQPFCDALCRGLLSRWQGWQEKLLLLARGRRRSVPGMSTAFLTVISTFRSIFVCNKV